MTKDYYTTQDIMETTGASRETVYLWRDYGLLQMSRLSRSFGCSADELNRFLLWAEEGNKQIHNEDHIRYWSKQKTQVHA